ncbi:MAG: nicotinate (nicotinamide) nucleotide adenylyltransferase [Candidatus Eisenbacteria bacterium]|nr:nicotinate (nicotinamide) nucleotide adenylyltransferase [Candidatus Eisenbacteria bacterium]
MRRIGLFGGTFDPPHLGHLALAEWARDRLALDRVLFMPAGVPPHKRGRALSGAVHRVAMARLAVRGHRAFAVSTLEARRRGPSFTVDTLRALKAAHPGARLYLLMGADSLDDFASWHEPGAIAGLATLVVAARPGAGRPRGGRRAGRGLPARIIRLRNPGIELSSSALRARARAGRSLRCLVPDAVAAYIARHRLYRGSR